MHGNVNFLTNHGWVLLALHGNSDLRQRDMAEMIGITEGAVHRILQDLESAGYIDIERIGRRNRYRVNPARTLRHPVEQGRQVGRLLNHLSSKPLLGDVDQNTLFEIAVN